MAEQEVVERRGREGGRWINERPTPDDFATWFQTSMKLDSALNFEDYIGGVVLIPAVDTKAKTVTGFRNGAPVIEERPELSFIPYAKVETRIDYFWDLVAAHEDWVAVVEHIESPRLPVNPAVEEVIETIESAEGEETGKMRRTITRRPKPVPALAQMVHQLPEGFSIATVPVGDGYSHFVCCTIRVSIYDRSRYEESPSTAVPLRTGRGTKQVPLLKGSSRGTWADDSSLMKAETGALGRALGFAGIFVIPGSGVATAEDVLESLAQGQTPSEATPEAPATLASTDAAPARTGAEAAKDEEQELRDRALALFKELKELSKEKANEFTTWAHGRRLTKISDAKGAMLRGVVKKLEKLTDEAKSEPPSGEPGGEPDVPSEATEATAAGAGEEATGDGDEPSGQAG